MYGSNGGGGLPNTGVAIGILGTSTGAAGQAALAGLLIVTGAGLVLLGRRSRGSRG
jgi:hypothetical protein